jgi:limonene-1,2-epoxide hydrolase
MPDEAARSIEAVRRLCVSWPELTEHDFGELLTPDCVYSDVPFPEAVAIGPAAAHRKLGGFKNDWRATFEIVAIVGDASTVMAERIEHFSQKQGSVPDCDLKVVGVFELDGGRIRRWTDYWNKDDAEPLFRFMAMKRQET